MRQKQAVTKQLALNYQRASKRKRGEILDWLVELTGYHRSYAARVLRQRAKPKVLGRLIDGGVASALVEDKRTKRRKPRNGPRKYDKEVLAALEKVWLICDCICGKRLAPFLPEIIPVLEQWEELATDEEVRAKLAEISPATIDRLLAPVKKQYQLRARAKTKPGTMLKHQIPIRTFSDWDEGRPGFVEVDLVPHDGGNAKGDFIQTLDLTDVYTGWTETRAVKNKAQVWVFEALLAIRGRLPFELLGLDSDNGSEFINAHLVRFCDENKITFTRSRPYRKNDNCFVEQKNYSVVRRAVGYWRYDTEEELAVLNELYDSLRLYTNFFQPVMKLIEKTRIGSKVKKKYDRAKTPYRRVLETPFILEEVKGDLAQEYTKLNPVELKKEIIRLQERLSELARLKRGASAEGQKVGALEYIFT
jgi:hypothetical protein